MAKFKTLLTHLLSGRRHENTLKDPKALSYSLLAWKSRSKSHHAYRPTVLSSCTVYI